MASLRKRGSFYYIVFTKREEGKLRQRVYSLKTESGREAKRLKFELEDRYDREEIDPFGDCDMKAELDLRRRKRGKGLTLREAGEKFLLSRSHVNEITKLNYASRLDRLCSFVGGTLPLRSVRSEHIAGFCFRAEFSSFTQRSYLRFCKMLFRWTKGQEYIDENPAADLRYPKRVYRISTRMISEEELHTLILTHSTLFRTNARQGDTREQHAWFRPLILLGFYTGLRRGEVLHLDWKDIDFKLITVTVREAKSGFERVIPIQTVLRSVLEAWHRLQGFPRSGLVFYKGVFDGRKIPLNPNYVTQVFKRVVRAADLPDTVNFHGLRHSCATFLLRKGMSLNAVAKWLGHASPASTMIYDHLNYTDLERELIALGLR